MSRGNSSKYAQRFIFSNKEISKNVIKCYYDNKTQTGIGFQAINITVNICRGWAKEYDFYRVVAGFVILSTKEYAQKI